MRRVRERDVLYVMQLLEENLVFDDRPRLSVRVNDSGRQCIRCEADTLGRQWLLDIYGKHFFYLAIPPRAPSTFDSVRGLLLYLQATLMGDFHAVDPSSNYR